MNLTPDDQARLLQEAATQLGWTTEPEHLVNRVRRLEIGLPIEDEFMVLCSWLGKCRLMHKLDQQQVPATSTDELQVPDLVGWFTTQTTTTPVLVEVKSCKDARLSFRSDYHAKLVEYATLLKAPLLIAWKYRSVWMLFDIRHMKKAVKNFNITLQTAMEENLLGVLAGDLAYKVGEGAGLHLRMRKDALLSQTDVNGSPVQEWRLVVDEVKFTDRDGNDCADLSNEVQALFFTWDSEERIVESAAHFHTSFVAGSDGIEFAHRALVDLLSWESSTDGRPHWRGLLQRQKITENIDNFTAAVYAGFKAKVISHIFHVSPRTMPEYVRADA